MILKLGMNHQGIELYKICINHDPGMTLILFTARSSSVTNAFEWEKCNQMAGNLLGMCKWTDGLCL